MQSKATHDIPFPLSFYRKLLRVFKYILITFFSLFCYCVSNGQIDALFKQANHCQEQRLKNIFGEGRNHAFGTFDTAMQGLLHSENICTTEPDSTFPYFLVNRLNKETNGKTIAYTLMSCVLVSGTADFKIYSWDGLFGGSYHTYFNYAIYKDQKGQCIAFPLDTSQASPEVGYYKVEAITSKGITYYLAFGYGTLGGGSQHFAVRLFSIQNGKLHESLNAYPNGKPIVISMNRSQTADLRFNKSQGLLSYYEPRNESPGKIVLRLTEGKLVPVKNGN